MMNEQEIRELVEKIADEGFSFYKTEQYKQAVVVDNKDPEKKGRVKIRVSGVHPTDFPENECPWVEVNLKAGSNQGQGESEVCQIGQFVEVRSLTSGDSEWIVTGGSPIVREELNEGSSGGSGGGSGGGSAGGSEDGKPYSNVENKVLEKESKPKLASTDKQKLMDTVYGIIQAKLISMGSNPELGDPPFPDEIPGTGVELRIFSNPVDLTSQIAYITSEKDLGQFKDKFYYYNTNKDSVPPEVAKVCSPTDTDLELTSYEHVYGWNTDGEKVYPKLDNWNLIIPPNVYHGETSDSYKDYTIKYKATNKENTNDYSENEIIFRVAGPDFVNSSLGIESLESVPNIFSTNQEETSNGVKVAETPEYNFKEYPPEDEKGVSEKKKVYQYPNGLAISIDGTEEDDEGGRNAYYGIKHPTGTRLEMFEDGRAVLKSNDSMQFVQGKNLLVNTGNTMEMKVGSRINLKVPKLYIECDSIEIVCPEIKIKGDIDIVGDINMEGDITLFGNITQEGNQNITGSVTVSNGDVVADGISLKQHKHMEQGDGAPTSPPM